MVDARELDDRRALWRGMGIAAPVALGAGIVALFFGVFGAWAAFAPLESAAVARGVISVETQRKTIQHLEGGIVGEIRVRDGDEVAADEILGRARRHAGAGDARVAAAAVNARRRRSRRASWPSATVYTAIAFPAAVRDSEAAGGHRARCARRSTSSTAAGQSVAGPNRDPCEQRIVQIQRGDPRAPRPSAAHSRSSSR